MGIIATEFVVECDECLESVGHFLHWESEREAREGALELGWHTWLGKNSWICPGCQAKRCQEPAEQLEEQKLDVALTLASARFSWASEKDLQDGIEQLLREKDLEYQREVQLSNGVIDFMVGDVGVEVKIKGQLKAVLSQLRRYAADPKVASLVLVTGRLQLTSCPPTINGKCLTVVPLMGSLF